MIFDDFKRLRRGPLRWLRYNKLCTRRPRTPHAPMEFVGNIDPAKCIVLLGVFGCSKKITMSPLLGMLKEGNIPC